MTLKPSDEVESEQSFLPSSSREDSSSSSETKPCEEDL